MNVKKLRLQFQIWIWFHHDQFAQWHQLYASHHRYTQQVIMNYHWLEAIYQDQTKMSSDELYLLDQLDHRLVNHLLRRDSKVILSSHLVIGLWSLRRLVIGRECKQLNGVRWKCFLVFHWSNSISSTGKTTQTTDNTKKAFWCARVIQLSFVNVCITIYSVE